MTFKPRFISFDCYGTLINFLGFMAKAFIDRAHEPAREGYGVHRLTDVRQLPGLLGL